MMKQLKVKTKLSISFGIVLLLMVVMAGFSISRLQSANDNLEAFMSRAVAVDDAVKDNRILMNSNARYLSDMALSKAPM